VVSAGGQGSGLLLRQPLAAMGLPDGGFEARCFGPRWILGL